MNVKIFKVESHSYHGEDELSTATEGSAGFDLRARVDDGIFVLSPGQVALFPVGLKMAIEKGYEGQIRPRSGLALKYGVTVLNAPGTIDSDYRDEVGVILINHGRDIYTVRNGDRIAQIVFTKVERPEIQFVNWLAATNRQGGYGSTGV